MPPRGNRALRLTLGDGAEGQLAEALIESGQWTLHGHVQWPLQNGCFLPSGAQT